MRFLCLHGGGTSAKRGKDLRDANWYHMPPPRPEILRSDLGFADVTSAARIRQALGREHEFVFVNGTVPSEPDAGAAAVTDEFFRYTGDNISQYRELYDDLLDVIQTRGPFDGVMGFSEGGAVAAFLLIEDARRQFARFKCAIFFSAAIPFDPDVVRTGIVRWVDAATDGVLVKIPTAHIWSDTNDVNTERARNLTAICDEGLREVFTHDLGHDVPGSKSDQGLKEAVRAIEHTIENARALCA